MTNKQLLHIVIYQLEQKRDALSLTAVMASSERGAAGTADLDASGIGFSYKMGGGLALVGGASEVDNVDKWDLGLTMSF